MPEMIRDGRGRGYLARINKDNHLAVIAVDATMEHYVNHIYGDAYNMIWNMSVTSGSDVNTLYVKNTGSRTVVLEGFNAQVSEDMEVYGKFGVTGTPVGGTDMEIGNLNAGSNKVMEVTALQGDGITGLTGGNIIWRSKLAGSNQSGFVNFDADMILPSQQTMAVYATSAVNWTSIGFFVCWVDQDLEV